MSDDSKIDVEVGANSSGVAAGMRQAVEAVKGGSEGMKAALEGLGGAFEAVMAPLLAFMAVLKGGEFLKESIDETIQMYSESNKLGRQLGITASEAGYLRTALGDVYSSTEQFTGAATALTRQVRMNEDAIKKMGLETRNSDGSFRNSKDLMLDAIQVLNTYKQGTDRNVAAQVLFGRGAGDLGSLLKLNNQVLEEAKEKQEALGLVITKEGTEAVAKYRAAMNDAGDVMEGVSQTVGTAVLPIFTQLAQWFADIGPTVVAVFKGAMEILVDVLQGLIDIVKLVWESCVSVFTEIASLAQDDVGGKAVAGFLTWDNAMKVVKTTILIIKEAIQDLVMVVRIFVEVTVGLMQMWHNMMNNLLNLDFSGAAASFDHGIATIEGKVRASVTRMGQMWKENETQFGKIWAGTDRPPATPAGSTGTGLGGTRSAGGLGGAGAGSKGGRGHEQTRTAGWDNELAMQKLALEQQNQENGTFYAFSKQQEADYWQHILNTVRLSAKEKVEVQQKYLAAALQVRKDEFEAHIAMLKGEQEHYQNNMDERLRIATEIANEMKQRFGEESKEYRQAATEITKIERAKADQIKAINAEIADAQQQAALDAVDGKQAQADFELQLGTITQNEMIQKEIAFENERYQINAEALQRKLQLMEADPDKNPVEYQKLKDQILEIERAHNLAVSGLQRQQVLNSTTIQRQGIQSLSQSWGDTLSKMMLGQMSFAQGVRSLWTGLVGAITQALTQMIAQWIARQLAAFILGKVAGGTSAASQITANAGVAGSAAFASTAAIPIIGPALAPGAAAAAMAGALAFMPMAFAEKGYDIPAGVNPITQLHQKEMVLPAEQADVIRGMAGGNGGGFRDLHFHAPGSMSRSEMERHASTLVRILKNAKQNRELDA